MKKFASIFLSFMALTTPVNAQNVLPQANLDLTPSVVRVGEYLEFNAGGSRNSQGQVGQNLEYRFKPSKSLPWSDFMGKSRGRIKVSTPGYDRVLVEVRDKNTGATQQTHRTFTVREERRPTPPRIKLLSEPPFSAGEQIGFEVTVFAESHINQRDIMVQWDFNSDGTFDTPWQSDKQGFYSYQGGNLTSPTVRVKYPGGRVLTTRGVRSNTAGRSVFDYARDVEKLRINPTRIQSPVVNVSPGTRAKSTDTTFEFDASRSVTGSNSYIEFYFDGVKKHTGTNIIKHRFTTPGDHVVRVRHCINRTSPECRTTEVNITIEDESATRGTGFQADFNASEVRPGVSQFLINQNVFQTVVSSPIRFTGRTQQTATGSRPKFQYRWDFDGDSVWDTPYAEQSNGEFVYDNPGTFKPQLEVRDDKGNAAVVTKTMIVLKNTKPVGRLRTASWPNYAGQDVQFQVEAADAQSSKSQLELRFDFDGDGVWDTDFRPTTSQRWTYDQAGEYEVTVQIRDPQKELRTISRTIPILETPAPQVKVTVSHRTQSVGQPIRLDASKTIGEGLSYEWKILDDPYAPVAKGQMTSLRFTTPGDRTICLRIIDQAGNIEEINFPVTITEEAVASQTTGATPPQGGGRLINDPPNVAEAISEFETGNSDFTWSDAGLINRPQWKLTGMRPGR